MRKMTLDEIKAKKRAIGAAVDFSVSLFRAKREEQGSVLRRSRPRDPDEVKALNYLARKKLRTSMSDGTVHYDKERRVLLLAKYTRS